MLKKTIKYTDFNDNEIEEDFYFNLSKAELTKLEIAEISLTDRLRAIVAENQSHKIVEVFEEFIALSYGYKSEDGKRFIKDDKALEEFKQTEAYSVLLMEFFTDPMAGVDFLKGMVSSDLQAKMDLDTLSKDPDLAREFPEQAEAIRRMRESESVLPPQEVQQRPQPQDHLPKQAPKQPWEQ